MSTFICDLDQVVSVLLAAARQKDRGITPAEAVSILAENDIEVPGGDDTAQAMNVRALLGWVNPSVGGNKRGPGGGFVPAEKLAPKEKKGQGPGSLINELRKQGVDDEKILAMLSTLAPGQGASATR